MSAAARAYIRGIVEGLTPSSLAMHRYADIDGPRAQSFPSLDAADGRTRLFELPAGEVAQVNLAGPDIQAMDERLSLRIRYDAAAADRVALHDAMRADQLQVAQALRAGAWAAVTGLAALTATPGRVDDIGDGEGRMLAHVAEVDIYISFDV